ncbi:hypothetical protein [Streptomyces sp. NPDC001601]|uniref:hypothetical protein n=1 Tax=Streptomyces sp. NPDC001601 TaxID=3364592 RepID=UPI0036852033
MNTATTGLAAGMALGFAGYFGGFWALDEALARLSRSLAPRLTDRAAVDLRVGSRPAGATSCPGRFQALSAVS